ncbi:MAG: TVP38/TMEM64 family protein [Lentisphaeria bacterium]|nr:TVP38/TMEM64 family protein [Lentisphaeria bacterium]
MSEPTNKPRIPVWLKAVIAVVAIGGVLTAGSVFDFQGRLHGLLHYIEELGGPGYAVFLGVYVVACVFFIPGSLLTLGAGAIYGVVTGSILVSVSSTVGATAAFLVGRYLARDWVAKKIQANAKFAAIDTAVGREGWKIVGLTRLSPVFPFALLNYGYGLTKVRLRDYILASWIGMLPGTVMYVYVGSLAKSLSAVGADCADCERGALQWILYAAGLLATVAVTVVVTRVARRALKEKVAD